MGYPIRSPTEKGPMQILSIVGARPNFMKVAPIIRALAARAGVFHHHLVHTGQHYDPKMSDAFFDVLGLPEPDFNLGVGSGSHAEQTGKVMMLVEPILADLRPDMTIVVGDVNSTLACALTAKKLNLKVAHVEAGLRSGDMSMPEEINRLCTDAICDLLFTTDRIADENLAREGVSPARIRRVGNVMIDSLLTHRTVAYGMAYHRSLGLAPEGYATLTLHRPSNVEDRNTLAGILDAVIEATQGLPVIFPIHPRTLARIQSFGLADRLETNIRAIEPLGYLQFLSLNISARVVLTDSGGLQEETTILGRPCVTIRENTERPITIEEGSNRLAGVSPAGILAATRAALASQNGQGCVPELWDGKAAERIVAVLEELR
jgi:UDP-N-acetylglucosamine 2-epimerase (non-hydrolysing)